MLLQDFFILWIFSKMNDKIILKNIKDLEYNHILNKQVAFLIFFGTSIISIILSEKLPEDISKWGLILALILAIVLSLLYFSEKLEEKINEIKNLNNSKLLSIF